MIKIEYAKTEAVIADFQSFYIAAFTCIGILGLIFYLTTQFTADKLRFRSVLLGCIVVYSVIIYQYYSGTFGRFNSLELDSGAIRLSYAGPFTKTQIIYSKDIDDVLFGLPSKDNRSCYILIKTKSGVDYQSITFMTDVEGCKRQRITLLKSLKQEH